MSKTVCIRACVTYFRLVFFFFELPLPNPFPFAAALPFAAFAGGLPRLRAFFTVTLGRHFAAAWLLVSISAWSSSSYKIECILLSAQYDVTVAVYHRWLPPQYTSTRVPTLSTSPSPPPSAPSLVASALAA